MKPKHDCGIMFCNFSELKKDIKEQGKDYSSFNINTIKNYTDKDEEWKHSIRGSGRFFVGVWAALDAKRVFPTRYFVNNLVIHSELMKELLKCS